MLAIAEDHATDVGPRSTAAGAERLCVATRTVRPVADMIRFVVGPDGAVVPDIRRRLPGRGVWVTATRQAVDEAIRRKAFARSFKREVRCAADLGAMVEGLLERAALDALSLANKAGLVAPGFGKVEAALAAAELAGLLHAADAGSDGVRKIAAAARRRFGAEAGNIPVVAAFTSVQLDLALGRPNVIHAALLAGPASKAFLARTMSLERFRKVDPNHRGGPTHDRN
ncbi:MAG: DNA-binding protein [Bradyrhizobiaceae bacterium]|nr:MAG: DNA-binding protein [Bradyrhizobiaceae bacterium]